VYIVLCQHLCLLYHSATFFKIQEAAVPMVNGVPANEIPVRLARKERGNRDTRQSLCSWHFEKKSKDILRTNPVFMSCTIFFAILQFKVYKNTLLSCVVTTKNGA